MNKILEPRGYLVNKRFVQLNTALIIPIGNNSLSPNLYKIQTDLTVSPIVKVANIHPPSFSIYDETECGKFIILPKCYGLTHFGKPDVDYLCGRGVPIRNEVTFTGKIRPSQVQIAQTTLDTYRDRGGGILCAVRNRKNVSGDLLHLQVARQGSRYCQ